MRKRLLNADDDKDDDENKLLRTRDMNVIQLNVSMVFNPAALAFSNMSSQYASGIRK
jgi:hypothetical protein